MSKLKRTLMLMRDHAEALVKKLDYDIENTEGRFDDLSQSAIDARLEEIHFYYDYAKKLKKSDTICIQEKKNLSNVLVSRLEKLENFSSAPITKLTLSILEKLSGG